MILSKATGQPLPCPLPPSTPSSGPPATPSPVLEPGEPGEAESPCPALQAGWCAGQSGSRGWCAWGATGRGALFPRGLLPHPKLPLPIRLSRETVSPASCCSKSESVFKRQAPGGWQAGTAAVGEPGTHPPPPPYPRMPIHPPGLRTLDSELRAESWMELWMGRGALTLYPQELVCGQV